MAAAGPTHKGWYNDIANARLQALYNGTSALHITASTAVFPLGASITTGGLTVTAGGLTVTAGGLTVTADGLTVTAGGLTVTAGGLTVTAGGLTLTAGDLLVRAGRMVQKFTLTDVDAQNNTLTVAQIVAGVVVHTSVTGGGTVTTDTAANILAGSGGIGVLSATGDSIICYYINDGTQTLTLAGGTGVTIGDAGQTLAADESAVLIFTRTGAGAVTCHIVGA